MTATDRDHPAASELDARYGRTKSKKRRDRWIYIIGGITCAIVVVSWVVWAGLAQSGASIDAEDTAHRIIDDRTVSISYSVSMPVGSTASCALQVQNEAHAIVGWRVVKIPASSSQYTTFHTDMVRSSELGVTGLIYACWLT